MSHFDRVISETVATTGEVIEYHVQSPDELQAALKDVEAHIKTYRDLKSSILSTGMDMLSRLNKKED